MQQEAIVVKSSLIQIKHVQSAMLYWQVENLSDQEISQKSSWVSHLAFLISISP